MTSRALFRIGTGLLTAVAGLVTPSIGRAQDAEQTQIERLTQEAALERARADRDRAAAERIAALGLPSFTGETKLGSNAGAIETAVMASEAARTAGARIGQTTAKIQPNRVVALLAADEVLDFGLIGLIDVQLNEALRLFQIAGVNLQSRAGAPPGPGLRTAGAAVAVASAVAGLLRSESTLTGIDVALPERALIAEIARHLPDRALIPSAATAAIPSRNEPDAWAEKTILEKWASLSTLRSAAGARRTILGDKPAEADRAEAGRLDLAISYLDALAARLARPNDAGLVMLAQAARLQAIQNLEPLVLRVHVEKAGGSLVNTKNIGTMLGIDPLKVSGAVFASYTLTEPADGRVLSSAIVTCRTTLTSIRSVQNGRWFARAGMRGDGTDRNCDYRP